MNPFTSSSLLLLLLLSPLAAAAAAPSTSKGTCKSVAGVEPTCKAAAAAVPGVVDYHLCVKSLKSDPAHSTADAQGLALSAARLALAHASSVESKIEDLVELEDDPSSRQELVACLEAFSSATDRIRDAIDYLNAGIYIRSGRKFAEVDGSLAKCSKELKGGEKGLLSEQDLEVLTMAAVAGAILSTVD